MDSAVGLFMDLDLNEDPEENRPGTVFVEMDSYREQIEDRIHLLEAITTRVRERASLNSASSLPENNSNLNSSPRPSSGDENGGDCVVAGGSGSGGGGEAMAGFPGEKFSSRDGVSLIAKALALDCPDERKPDEGEFFDCNMCLGIAKNPILTCCGHLFCWPCFYKVPFVSSSSTARECPKCKGEVGDDNITPIYGNASGSERKEREEDYGFRIPPRPHAHRVESMRQLKGSQHTRIMLDERIRQIRNRIRLNAQPNLETSNLLSGRMLAALSPDARTNAQSLLLPSIRLLSGITSPGRNDHSSASPLFDSLESSGDNVDSDEMEQRMRAWTESVLSDDRNSIPSNLAAWLLEGQGQDAASQTSSLATQDDRSAAVAQLEHHVVATADDNVAATTQTLRPSSSRRRSIFDSDVSHSARRRRLRNL